MLTKKKLAVQDAYEKGYRVVNGSVVYKNKTRKLFTHFKRSGDNMPYYSFGVRYNKDRVEIYVHQLLAYQMYGKRFLEDEWSVIHIDNNSLNNIESNIKLK